MSGAVAGFSRGKSGFGPGGSGISGPGDGMSRGCFSGTTSGPGLIGSRAMRCASLIAVTISNGRLEMVFPGPI